jgi:beta-lactamase class D
MILATLVLLASLTDTPSSATTRPIDLGALFPQAEATFVALDTETGETFVHNEKRAATGFLPASTFKIPNTLIAIETHALIDPYASVPWDKAAAPRQAWWPESWTRPQTLPTAFADSVVWYYQRLAREIGPEQMQDWLHRFEYGNESIGGGIDRFWLSGDLRISALEQVGFLERLRSGRLPVRGPNRRLLQKMMQIGRIGEYEIAGKTGTATLAQGRDLAWLVGYADRKGKVWVYAMNLEGKAVAASWPRDRRAKTIADALALIENERAASAPKPE